MIARFLLLKSAELRTFLSSLKKKKHVWLFLKTGQMCSSGPSNFSHLFVKPNIAKHLFTFAFLVSMSYLNINFKAYCIKDYIFRIKLNL